jgi:hypothetical protein
MCSHKRPNTSMLLHLIYVLVVIPSCSSDKSQPVDTGPPIATIGITVDSVTLLVGHVAHASATVKDSAGNTINTPEVGWTSLTPGFASISPLGAIVAVSSGSALIEARVGGVADTAVVPIVPIGVVPPDLADYNFDDGLLGPYTDPYHADQDRIDDPTGFHHGKVARIHYSSSTGSQDRAFYFSSARLYGEPLYFKGDFYIATNDIGGKIGGVDLVQRKLIYWQSYTNSTKYPIGHNGVNFRTVVSMFGDQMLVDATFNPAAGGGNSDTYRTHVENLATIAPNTWYTLEVFQQLESNIGGNNGILRVWLNGNKIFEKTSMRWTDPNWVGATGDYLNPWGAPLDAQDIFFRGYLVGEQYDNHSGTGAPFDEYRYWDNVSFSTQPIAHY